MLAFILAPFYILVNLYLAWWVLRWTGSCHRLLGTGTFRVLFAAAYAFAALSPLTGFLIKTPIGLRRWLRRLSNDWMGWLLYLALAVAVSELALFVIRKVRHRDFAEMQRVRRMQGGAALLLICAVCLYGTANARALHVTDYSAEIDKPGEDMTLTLLADLHLGYNTDPAYIERAVREINAMKPDLVVIAGDIFDNEYDAVPEPERIAAALSALESTYGVYACWGNHDLAEPILAGFTFGGGAGRIDPRMERLLAQAGVTLLDDSAVTLPNGVQLAGRKDPSRSRKTGEQRLSPAALLDGLDRKKPVLVMDHQPAELEQLAEAGADLDLSGHTHDGQIFPGNLTVRLAWDNACGYLRVGNMHSIVTAGLGVWGPGMRVGTRSEIVRIAVHFTAGD